ncbi:MAG: MFS transporter, partial [Alphaproteobacteria bacterium]|nr:MFS transporter [Alphaproteobacteria bacterium]
MSKWKNNRLILATSAGHILEYYDSTLYGFFAVMLAPLFFPSESPAIATICSFIVFAAGFVMRPFGGLIFGHLGDRYGRKIAFLLSIALVTVPTFGIGCLPTYEMIGVAAPFLLISFRLLQGISVGGEYGGAA